jgi:hypothetical protein
LPPVLVLLLVGGVSPVEAQAGDAPPLVVFSDCRAEAAGNAHWTIDGAYSRWADLLRAQGWRVEATSTLSGGERITDAVLVDARVLVLPEPNTRFDPGEIALIRAFVRSGGGLVAIGDHGGSDRNFDGYDSTRILNELCAPMGFRFVGDNISEAPLEGGYRDHPLLYGVGRVGAWGATSIEILDRRHLAPILLSAKAGAPILVAGRWGRGRVVAFGDSSPFDDGTGEPGKILHASMDSFLYDHPQLAVNMVLWAGGVDDPPLVRQGDVPLWRDADPGAAARSILVDAAHDNPDADRLAAWRSQLREAGYAVYFTMSPWSPVMLARFRGLVVTAPAASPGEGELAALRSWLQQGGRLLLTAASHRTRFSRPELVNRILAAVGARLRVERNEIRHPTQICRRTWCLLVDDFGPRPRPSDLRRIIVWRTAGLRLADNGPLQNDLPGIEILLRAPAGSVRHVRGKDAGATGEASEIPPVLGAAERVGQGTIILLGACTFTDYQYPGSPVYPAPYRSVDHQTPRFNLGIIERLMMDEGA